ncbi:helix-turn-helix transcriptional regulator [Alkalihalobacillus trypoxylicola]|uniref:HTH deoR-type domain-containing protein n=1 Tax=Alkalihalobacillus trypoxylicola TaxID=519424 RepID=A0A162DFH2_9BACI|nr:YafY family protein [Alkalihalobacillus trypoxylicola]KYG29464.1 hypothetical protein AZF04_08045 [Alkalihalobacillus trypoxylicola]
MRAERLLDMIILLQNRGRMTTKELADELHVSQRTILRDMDSLSLAGIPIYSKRGKYGGWEILNDYKLNLMNVKEEDLYSLIASPSEKVLNDLGVSSKKTIEVREKILSSLPTHTSDKTKFIWERIYMDTEGWRESKESLTYLGLVQTAVFESKQLRIIYKGYSGEEKEVFIMPLGLVIQNHNWYLVAKRGEEFRNYRISRILSATVLDIVFERPPHFQLKAYWEASKKRFIESLPQFPVEVEVNESILSRLTYTSKFVQLINKEQQPGGVVKAQLVFNDKQEALEYILGFGHQLKIISPTYLIEELIISAEQLLLQYK